MKFKLKPKNKLTESGMAKRSLMKELNSIHLKLLRIERGMICELCGKPGMVTRFHIFPTGRYPRLRFVDGNVLLAHWMECCGGHYAWHHHGGKSDKVDWIKRRIAELRGSDWEEKLTIRNAIMPKHDTFYLSILLKDMTQKLKSLINLTKEGLCSNKEM